MFFKYPCAEQCHYDCHDNKIHDKHSYNEDEALVLMHLNQVVSSAMQCFLNTHVLNNVITIATTTKYMMSKAKKVFPFTVLAQMILFCSCLT